MVTKKYILNQRLMKKIISFALMLLMCVSMSAAKKAKAPQGIKNGPLSFNRVECNLGRVDAGTQTRTMTFDFVNNSKTPVSISDIQWEGARLEVSWLVNPTPPQGRNTITVEWTPNYHWEDIPDRYAWKTPIKVLYTDGKKNYTQTIEVGGTIYLKRSEVFNRRIGRLRMHRLYPMWNFCVCGDELPFTMQYANLTDKKMDVQFGLADRQGHIYQSPFYYIDYTLAQVCALQFYVRMLKNDENAWKDYVHICGLGGTKTFTEIVKEANLIVPFEDGCLSEVSKKMKEELEKIDDMKM